MDNVTNEINWTRFFRFSKKLIELYIWAKLSKAARAIFPVIACHCDENGVAFTGEKTISKLSGRSEKTVRKAIKDLKKFKGFYTEEYVTKRGKLSKKFHLIIPPQDKGQSFIFHRGLIDSGIWSRLPSVAQALYPVMRYLAKYDPDEDENAEDTYEFLEDFRNRNWDICLANMSILSIYAKIDRHSVAKALKSLGEMGLIEPYETIEGSQGWKVFFIPQDTGK